MLPENAANFGATGFLDPGPGAQFWSPPPPTLEKWLLRIGALIGAAAFLGGSGRALAPAQGRPPRGVAIRGPLRSFLPGEVTLFTTVMMVEITGDPAQCSVAESMIVVLVARCC